MAHTYADVALFKDFLRDGGNTDLGTTNDAQYLLALEGASRSVDAYCARSSFGSGFGPRIATNRYDWWGESCIELKDDFLGFSTVTVYSGTGGASSTIAAETDFYPEPYDKTPYRRIRLHGLTTVNLGSGFRVLSVGGTAGYSSETLGGLTMGTVSSSATSATLSAGSAWAGQTLLNESEQMYVTASTGGTALTVVRGVNGTTAAAHAAGNAVTVYKYDRAAAQGTLLIAQRRLKMGQSGLTGDYGGEQIPATSNRDSERAILRNQVGHLRVYSAG